MSMRGTATAAASCFVAAGRGGDSDRDELLLSVPAVPAEPEQLWAASFKLLDRATATLRATFGRFRSPLPPPGDVADDERVSDAPALGGVDDAMSARREWEAMVSGTSRTTADNLRKQA